MATKQRKRKSLKRKKSLCSPANRIKRGRKTTPLKATPNKLSSIGQQTLDIPNKTTPRKLSLLLPSASLESKQFVSPSLEQTPELFSSCESDHTQNSVSVPKKNTYTSPGYKKAKRTLFTKENDKGLVEKVDHIRKNIMTEFDEIKRSDKHFMEVGELKSSGDEEEMGFLKDLRLSDIENDSDQSDVFPLSHDCHKQTVGSSELLSCIPRRFQVVKCSIQDCTSGQPNGWYVLLDT